MEEGDAEPEAEARSNLALLRHPNFGPYFLGNLLSNCGTWFQNIAQALLIFRLTGSTFLVGVVNFAQFVGVFALAPWAGSAADRFDRRRLLIVTQVGAVVVTALLALLSAADLAPAPVVIFMALLLGLSTAFAIPALQALVPLLVSTTDLGPAIALNSVSFTLARAVGPALGAIVVGSLGIAAAFAFNSVSYLALIVALFIIKPTEQGHRTRERPRLADSVKLLRDDAYLAAMLLIVAGVTLATDPVSTLTPGFATHVFHHSDSLTGYLVAAFGSGSVVAGLTIAGRSGEPERRIAVTGVILGVGMVGFGLAPNVGVALVMLFIAGFGFLATTTTTTTVLQLRVDDRLRGRVMALWSVAFLGMRPFGSLIDGGAAAGIGLRGAAVVMAVPSFAVAAMVTVTLVRRGRAAGG